jgi:CRISPR/Cas system endoribonuclease Cas6 (RAMP superfamily)
VAYECIKADGSWHVIGFSFEGWEDRNLVQFALDAGLGERNSLGFGFMNMKIGI